jgi:hypothetical protein
LVEVETGEMQMEEPWAEMLLGDAMAAKAARKEGQR